MGSELVRRISENAGISVRSGSERVPRPVLRQLERAAYQGLEMSARVQAAAYVTHVALLQVGMLTAEEARMIQQHPLGEPRFRVIVDTFAGVAAAEIARLGY